MATTAPVIGTDWTPLASAGDNFFLTIQQSATHGLWVAASDTGT